MKRQFISLAVFLIIGTVIALFPLPSEQPKSSPTKPKTITAQVHAERVEPTPEPTPAPTPILTWQDNPQGCRDDQWIAAEEPFSCIDKPQPVQIVPPQPNVASKTATAPQANYPETPGGSVQDIIIKWANHYGVSADWLLRVARCESGLNPGALNTGYFAGGGHPSGVFQFLPQTFYANAARIGLVGANLWNVEHQAQVAAWMFSIGQHVQWQCK